MSRALYLLFFGIVAVTAQRRLALPDPKSCANRKLIDENKKKICNYIIFV